MDELKRLPVVSLQKNAVLPPMTVHFDIKKTGQTETLAKALTQDGLVFLTMQENEKPDPLIEDLSKTGVIARIRSISPMPGDSVRIIAQAQQRAALLSLDYEDGMMRGEVQVLEDVQVHLSPVEKIAMMRGLRDLFSVYAQENRQFSRDLAKDILNAGSLEKQMELVILHVPFSYKDKQRILETGSVSERYEMICVALTEEVGVARVRSEIGRKVRERVDKNQREYLLREQMKVIMEELGDELPQTEAQRYLDSLEKLDAPEKIKERIGREIRRFKGLAGNSAEMSVARNYIETLLEMPWNKVTPEGTDLRVAAKVLDEDHYGLEKVKERMLEFMAVRMLAGGGDSPIICLVGPPGTGKTSVARSVARALGKTYVRISLGGVRDEAEIRGHRRTYIGAMPGRIAQALRQCGTSNPLMLLDEIDKVGNDYKGDPASALLEALDSEQNRHFQDHYLEVELDLSRVLFLTTANDLSTIPRPLLDRMEIIEITSYTDNEKLHIAREHLLPKQLAHNGLRPGQVHVTDGALREIISGYTREAGVRSLERKLGEICRKAVRKILEDGEETVRVNKAQTEQFLGKRKYRDSDEQTEDAVGICHGLAWTQAGGTTLQIEVNTAPGKGELLLTGQLGDVMKESARAGISYIRMVAGEYKIPDTWFAEHDIHIHIPEGAVPKDGPSAGITMASAMLSAISGLPVRGNVAMTGEITLRGRVLPVGGLKEKLLAAGKAGLMHVLLPSGNRADIAEISQEITGPLKITYVKTMDEVLAQALARPGSV